MIYPTGYTMPTVPWDGFDMRPPGGGAYHPWLAHYLYRLSVYLVIDSIPFFFLLKLLKKFVNTRSSGRKDMGWYGI